MVRQGSPAVRADGAVFLPGLGIYVDSVSPDSPTSLDQLRKAAKPGNAANGTWTNARPDAAAGTDSDVEKLGAARAQQLKDGGIVLAYSRRTVPVELRGLRGGLIGTYTYDYDLNCIGGLSIAWEIKGRESRDFPLRRDLYRDNYCTHSLDQHRLDVVPVLTFQEARELGMGTNDLVATYNPLTWPTMEAELAKLRRGLAAAQSQQTRRINAALREQGLPVPPPARRRR